METRFFLSDEAFFEGIAEAIAEKKTKYDGKRLFS